MRKINSSPSWTLLRSPEWKKNGWIVSHNPTLKLRFSSMRMKKRGSYKMILNCFLSSSIFKSNEKFSWNFFCSFFCLTDKKPLPEKKNQSFTFRNRFEVVNLRIIKVIEKIYRKVLNWGWGVWNFSKENLYEFLNKLIQRQF